MPDNQPRTATPLPTVRRRERSAGRQNAARDADRAAAREEKLAQQSWVEGAEPALPTRTTRPEDVVFHLGPTNSGKTYESLQALAKSGSGVYAAPLRQLAHEAYAKLSSSPVDRPTVPSGSWAASLAYASCASWRSGAA